MCTGLKLSTACFLKVHKKRKKFSFHYSAVKKKMFVCLFNFSIHLGISPYILFKFQSLSESLNPCLLKKNRKLFLKTHLNAHTLVCSPIKIIKQLYINASMHTYAHIYICMSYAHAHGMSNRLVTTCQRATLPATALSTK